jgi:hypothetical protein
LKAVFDGGGEKEKGRSLGSVLPFVVSAFAQELSLY